jgi:putative solute:sodium symporter small subunit
MDREAQAAYWRGNLRRVVLVLGIWLAVSCLAATLLADVLDRVRVGGFPLGFWFAHQGAVVVFVLLVAGYVRTMNALDRKHGVFED